jgi:hypothetical protein
LMSCPVPVREVDPHTKLPNPTMKKITLAFNIEIDACHTISCSVLGFYYPPVVRFPSTSRILRSPSGWLARRERATACRAEIAIDVRARTKALYNTARMVAWSESVKRATDGHVYDVAMTAPNKAL